MAGKPRKMLLVYISGKGKAVIDGTRKDVHAGDVITRIYKAFPTAKREYTEKHQNFICITCN